MFYEEVNTNEEIITPGQLIEFANHWTQAGANIISGCCGLGPDHTQALCNLKQTISIHRRYLLMLDGDRLIVREVLSDIRKRI